MLLYVYSGFSEYGIHLTEITLEVDGHLPLRQMAALLLKQYVDAHWSSEAEKFKEPEATPKAKASIRAMLPIGLKESISKVSGNKTNCELDILKPRVSTIYCIVYTV